MLMSVKVMAVVAVVVVSSCANSADTADGPTTSTATQSTTSVEVTTTTREVDATTSSTTVDFDNLPPCTEDMGSTSQAPDETDDIESFDDLEYVGWWGPDDLSGFDWDQDGNPDQVTVNRDNNTITLTWGASALTITSIRTDFDRGVYDAIGRGHNLSPAEVGGRAETVVPVAVGDVTGDGWLDLIVANMGTLSVLAGAGDNTPTGEMAFDAVGVETLGWQSPPIQMLGPLYADGTRDFDQIHPTPNVLPAPVADRNGDAVQDFVAHRIIERGGGPPILLLGRACTTAPGGG
jgi:hypothetical protein